MMIDRHNEANFSKFLQCVCTLPQREQAAGIEFIDENGGGPAVRLKKRQQKKKTEPKLPNEPDLIDGVRLRKRHQKKN